MLMSFMLKKLKISLSKKEWIKSVMRRLWFYELFDAVLFLRLMSVGEIATWVFLDWKGRALSKRGVVYGTLVFMQNGISGWQTTKRLLCGKLQWWPLPRYGHIFVHNFMQFSVGLKIFCYGWGKWRWGEGGEISTCTSCCLRDIKVMKILQVKIVANAYGKP